MAYGDHAHGYEPDHDMFIPGTVYSSSEPFDFHKKELDATVISLVPSLVEMARASAKTYSESWRGFCVGAAGVVFDLSETTPRIGIYGSGNFKATIPEEEKDEYDIDSIPKFCAEMDVQQRASLDGFQYMPFIAVSATTRSDRIKSVMGVEAATLHPCFGESACSNVLKYAGLAKNNTIIMSVGTGQDIYQVQTRGQYMARYKKFYQTGVFKDADTYAYSKFGWDDKLAFFNREAKRMRLGGNVYTRKPQKREMREKLALLAMTEGSLKIDTFVR